MSKILVVSDIHAGCYGSIMPPVVKIGDDMELHQSQLQRLMFRAWQDMCDAHEYDACFVLGDSVNGVNKHENGAGNWTNDVDKQVETAVALLRMTGAKKFYGVQGSGYHTSLNTSADKLVIDALGGIFDEDLHIHCDDVHFYLKHVVGASSVIKGRGTSLNGDMEAMKMYPETYGDVDVHLRGHAHYHHAVWWERVWGIVAPAWKFKDAFMKRGKVTFGQDCGYLVFDTDNGKVTWESFTFKIPRELAITEHTL